MKKKNWFLYIYHKKEKMMAYILDVKVVKIINLSKKVKIKASKIIRIVIRTILKTKMIAMMITRK